MVYFSATGYREPVVIKDLVTPSECEYFIRIAHPYLQPAKIGYSDPNGNVQQRVDIKARLCDTALFTDTINYEDTIIKRVLQRISKMLNKHFDCFESFQVTRYKINGFYGLRLLYYILMMNMKMDQRYFLT